MAANLNGKILQVLALTVMVASRGSVEAKSVIDGDKDTLVYFTYAFDRELRPILEEKLIVTPGDYGRMLRMHGPFDRGESAVSVYCDRDQSNTGCFVTLTRGRANMDYTMEENRENQPLQKVRKIPIARKDTQIPRKVAIAFRDCLRVMIPKPGDFNRLHPLTITDDDRIEFWLDEPNMPIRKGERAEYPGKRTKALISIGDLLARYVEASASERPAIAKQIENQASRILAAGGNKPKSKK